MASLASTPHVPSKPNTYLLAPSPEDDIDTQRGRKRRRSSASNHVTSHGSTTLRGRGRHRTPSPSQLLMPTQPSSPFTLQTQDPGQGRDREEAGYQCPTPGSASKIKKSPGRKYQRFGLAFTDGETDDADAMSESGYGLGSSLPPRVRSSKKEKARRSQSLSRSRSRGCGNEADGERVRMRRRQRTRTRSQDHGLRDGGESEGADGSKGAIED